VDQVLALALGVILIVAGGFHVAAGIAHQKRWVQGRLDSIDEAVRQRRSYGINVLAPNRWILDGRARAVVFGLMGIVIGV
jgi:hypothetical protein